MNKIIFCFVIIVVMAQIYAMPQAPAADAGAAAAPGGEAAPAAGQGSPQPSGRLSPFFLLQPMLNVGKSMVAESEKALNQLMGAFPGRERKLFGQQ